MLDLEPLPTDRHIRYASSRTATVVVTDVDIHFGSMVWVMVKLAFASIPAALIVWALSMAFGAALVGFFSGIGG